MPILPPPLEFMLAPKRGHHDEADPGQPGVAANLAASWPLQAGEGVPA
jgi:hypothetical protein